MSRSTKLQDFTYSMKTVALSNYGICADKTAFYIVPPQNAINIKQLRTNFQFRFDSSINSSYRVLKRIGIISGVNFTNPEEEANYFRYLDLNLAADGNREVSVQIDLTSLLKQDNVNYNNNRFFFTDDDYTMVYIKFPDELANEANAGDALLWKIDALFTTTGIR